MNIKNLIVGAGLAAMIAGCATGKSEVRTQDSPVDVSVSGTGYESTSASERFARLKELDTSSGGSPVSVGGYVMRESTELDLRNIAGIRSSTIEVITDGEGNFLSEGRYSPAAHQETMDMALKEADTNGDRIITSDEAEQLSQRVFDQYAKRVGKEEFRRKACTSQRKKGLGNCGFTQDQASSECEFGYRREKGDVDFDKRPEEGDCEFEAFKTHSDPKPCLDSVAKKYAERAQQVEAAYAACLEGVKTDVATCESKVEEMYKACLGAGSNPATERSGKKKGFQEIRPNGEGVGVDEEGNIFERVYDGGT